MRAVTASVDSCVLERFEDRLVFGCGELLKSPLPTQQTNIFSKSTIESLEKGVIYVMVTLLLTLNMFYNFF